jgi:hypothetical protein
VTGLVGCAPTVTLSTVVDPPTASAAPDPTGAAPASPAGSPPAGSPPAGSPVDALATAPAGRAAPLAPVGSFVLGDSISLGAGPALARLGYPVVGRVGQSATELFLAEHLSSAAAQQAPAWVLILGTNNPGDQADVAALEDRLDLLARLRPGTEPPPVYWVTPYRDPRYRGGLSTYSLDAFNDELRLQAERRPWLHVIDFATIARLHPEWFTADGSHLHPDQAGYGVLAALIAGPDAVPLLAPAPLQTLDLPRPEPTAPTSEPAATAPGRRPVATTAPAPTGSAPASSTSEPADPEPAPADPEPADPIGPAEPAAGPLFSPSP